MAQPFLENLEALVDRHLAGVPDLVCKHFFSGAALYSQGTICVSLTPVGLAFKLPEPMCAELIETGAASPLKYFEKSPIKRGYALFAEVEELSTRKTSKYFQAAVANT
ncbi:MAG: TfoX/Sxy family protein [Planctomycetes bacterium]|nr:TfoX/Sxy family protein [Planctomycetota bacterium]